MTITLDIVKGEDGASAGRKLGDSVFHVHLLVWVAGVGRAVMLDLDPGEVGCNLYPQPASPAAAPALEHRVHRNAMKPRREPALTAIRCQPLPDPDENVLDEFFGLGPIAAETEAQRKYAPGVGVVNGGKCCLVAALCSAYRGVDQDLAGRCPKLDVERYV